MAEQLNIDPSSWEKREARLRSMTRTLILRHRQLIESVADALLVSESLRGEAIDELAGRSVNDVKVNAPWLLEIAAS